MPEDEPTETEILEARIVELETEVLGLRQHLGAKGKAAVQRIEEQQATISDLQAELDRGNR